MRPWLTSASLALNIVLVLAVGSKWRHQNPVGPTAYRQDRLELLARLPTSHEATVLAGDSLTDRCEWAELLGTPRALNRGIAGDRVQDLLARSEMLVSGRPRRLVLMVGINDLAAGRTPAEVAADYERLLLGIRLRSPTTRIIVQSVLPVNERLTPERVRNVAVRSLNHELRALARDSGCEFLDVAAHLSDGGGGLDERFTRDGIHLNGAGYAAWAEALRGSVR